MTEINKYFSDLIEINHHKMIDDLSADSEHYKEQFVYKWGEVLESIDTEELKSIRQVRSTLSALGQKEQSEFWKLNDALKNPLQSLMDNNHSGEKINAIFRDLQKKIANLKPPKKSNRGLKSMFLLLFSWKQTAWQLWLENYHELKAEIKSYSDVLMLEKAQLSRDNQMLLGKQCELGGQLKKIEHSFDLLSLLAEQLQQRINYQHNLSQKKADVLANEFLPVVQQRVIELQQQLLIGRQSLMTIDLIAKQNVTQTKNIDRALQTTSQVLDVTAGLVLAEQGQIALDEMGQAHEVDSTEEKTQAERLKKVQQSIEQALQQMEGARKAYKQINTSVAEVDK